jgi:transcriptional regulator
MFYEPAHFKIDEREHALALMREFPLATLVSVADGELAVSHVPLIARERDGAVVLLGHVAKANPHWSSWADGAYATAIFRGPDSYVSPSWYTNKESVPTWNYMVVHASGPMTVTHDSAAKERILKALIDAHDPPYREHWDVALTEEFRERQKSAIVGFEIAVDRLQVKFKLSQNRQAVDKANVLAAMERGEGAQGAARVALARWMRRLGIGV